MGLVLRVILSTALVLGLIRLLAYGLTRYGSGVLRMGVGLGVVKTDKRMRLIETLTLPGGVMLYMVAAHGREMLLASSRSGLQLLDVGGLNTAERPDYTEGLDAMSDPD